MSEALAYIEECDYEYDKLLLQTVDNFLTGWFAYSSAEEITENIEAYFAIRGEVPAHFRELIQRLITLYNNNLDPTAAYEFIAVCHRLEELEGKVDVIANLRDFLDRPEDEFIDPPSIYKDANFTDQAATLYTLHAVGQFNQLLPLLQKQGFAAAPVEALLKLQQAAYHAETACLCVTMLEHFKDYQPPSVRMIQASNGGRARAEKLYGNTKKYAAKRFGEIRAKGSKLSMSQIAQKIAYELEENPIASDEPLTNPYDTIYRWVRALNKAGLCIN